jgi:hypothetical protein
VVPAISAPGDITQIAAPTLGSDPPKAEDIQDGDASVATQIGSLNFTFPIKLPPGRAMAPSLSLGYSSLDRVIAHAFARPAIDRRLVGGARADEQNGTMDTVVASQAAPSSGAEIAIKPPSVRRDLLVSPPPMGGDETASAAK